jgi:hypothetical protein
LTKQEFRWLVFMERGLEFAGEQKRWFDLIRMKYDENTQMYDYIKDTFIPSRPAGCTKARSYGCKKEIFSDTICRGFSQ